MAIALDTGELRLTDAEGAVIKRFTLTDAQGNALSLAFAPDGQCLAVHLRERLDLYDLVRSRRLTSIETSASNPPWISPNIAFSPDGRWLATCDADSLIRLRSATTGAVVATLEGHGASVLSLAFSPDGTRLATGAVDYTIRLWDIPSGREVAVLHGHVREVDDVAFGPNGDLASVGGNELYVWSCD
jgi:WD40 repeat protein